MTDLLLRRMAWFFDANDTAASFLSEDGDGGYVKAVIGMTCEIERLRAMGAHHILDEAVLAELVSVRFPSRPRPVMRVAFHVPRGTKWQAGFYRISGPELADESTSPIEAGSDGQGKG